MRTDVERRTLPSELVDSEHRRGGMIVNDSPDKGTASTARVVLAKRNNGAVRVTLLWAEETNRVAVFVRDLSTDDHFELSVEADGNALDAFEHPYAYAAWRGVHYRLGDRRCAA